jgi:amino acid adenylation domain-containing protein
MNNLSSVQNNIYFSHVVSPNSSLNNICGYSIIHADINYKLLCESILYVLKNADSLNLLNDYFIYDNSVFNKNYDVIFEDLVNSENADTDCLNWINNNIEEALDIESGYLIQTRVFKISKFKYYWYVKVSHILFDGLSMNLFFKKVFDVYYHFLNNLPNKTLENKFYYTQFLTHETNYKTTRSYKNDYLFWKKEINSINKSKAFHSCFQNENGDISLLSNRKELKITRTLFFKINQFCTENKFSITNYFIAAIHILNKQLNNDFCTIGLPIFNRDNFIQKNTLGTFVKTLPVSIQTVNINSVTELLSEVKRATLESYRHKNFPLIDLFSELNIRESLYNVIFSYQKNIYDTKISEIDFEINFLHNKSQVEDLQLHLLEYSDKGDLQLFFDYKTGVFSEDIIDSIIKNFERVLQFICNEPNALITQFNVLNNSEKKLLLEKFNNTEQNYPDQKNLAVMFEEQAAKTPNAIAIIFNKVNLCYKEVNDQANELANYLISKYKIQADDLLGIKLERSEQMVIAMLAVLKSGGAYVPIDREYPKDRIDYILNDSNCKVLIDEEEFYTFKNNNHKYSNENLNNKIKPKDLAYVIYTSGSTGKPKGVMIEHKNACSFIYWCIEEFKNSDFNVVLGVTSICFDLSVFEIFYTLSVGKTLRLLDHGLSISENIGLDEKILVNTVPSVVGALINRQVDFSKISVLNMAGEPIPANYIDHLELKKTEVRNLYGPSEDTTYSTCYKINNKLKILIGKPIGNTQIYILNNELNLLPIGVTGEICIGGHGLARGYLNNASLTAEKFVNNPFIPNDRIYRTGDLGRLLSSGDIECLGRKDDQVKIRGYRIEVGEIENALKTNKKIENAIVIAKQLKSTEKELVAYFVSKQEISVTELRAQLGKYLPVYMIPGYFVQLDKMPLTPNGKINKNSLPLPGHDSSPLFSKYIAPKNKIEEKLTEIWSEVLSMSGENIGIQDDFFELGGHSLKAMRLIAGIHKAFNIKLTLKQLFEQTKIEGQAILINSGKQNTYVEIQQVKHESHYELSSSQLRLWMLSQISASNVAYNMPGIYILKGELDKVLLEKAFDHLINRHEILRTTFKENEGKVRQYITSEQKGEFKIEFTDLKNDKFKSQKSKEIVDRTVQKSFDLANGPLLTAGLIAIEENTNIFIFVMHHIISDAWSISILIKEVLNYYNSYKKGLPIIVNPLRIHYKDYSVWQQKQVKSSQLKNHKDFWLNEFKGELPVLEMPTDKLRPAIKSYNGNTIQIKLSSNLLKVIKSFCQQENATVFMGLLGAVNILLYYYSQQTEIIIGTPIAGREQRELEDQIGFYVNTIGLRTQFNKDVSYRELLQIVKKNVLNAYDHQAYPFDALIGELGLTRDMSRNPLFDIMLVLINQEENNLNIKSNSIEGIEISNYKESKNVTSKFDLLFTFIETKDSLELSLEYNSDLYEDGTVYRIATHIEKLLKEIIAHPDLPINTINFINDIEKQELLENFNDTAVEYKKNKTVIGLFEEEVNKHPDNIAIAFSDQSYSYKTLNEVSNQFSFYLKSTFNIEPADKVAIQLERSEKNIVSIIGVLKLGATYIPMDVDYPQERIDLIKDESKFKVIINDLVYEQFLNRKNDFPVNKQNTITSPGNIAYIIYTSGSTGQPKGIMMSNQAMVNLISFHNCEPMLQETNKVLQCANMSFDVSFQEIFTTLSKGATLFPVSDEIKKDVLQLSNFIVQNKLDTLFLPTAYFKVLMEDENFLQCISKFVKNIIVAGEQLILGNSIIDLIKNSKLVIHNHYGPAETHVVTTFNISETNVLQIGNIPSIGKPISNTQIYILNNEQSLLPLGVIGEIYISGDCLAKGYLNKSELTFEKFIQNPFKANSRMYRTGDLGKWLPDGNIEYIGRKDDQVKIRGYRIELGEIESALKKITEIEEAVVIVRQNENNDKDLVAYITSIQKLDELVLKNKLKAKLPTYMVPALIMQVDKIPITKNGKTDKNALLQLEGSKAGKNKNIVVPRNEVDKKLLEICAELLTIDKVTISIKDNFFDLGAHSLKITQLISRIYKDFNVKVQFNFIFQNPDIESISNYIIAVSDIKSYEIQTTDELII